MVQVLACGLPCPSLFLFLVPWNPPPARLCHLRLPDPWQHDPLLMLCSIDLQSRYETKQTDAIDECWWLHHEAPSGANTDATSSAAPSALLLRNPVRVLGEAARRPQPLKDIESTLRKHTSHTSCLAVSRNGKYVVAAGVQQRSGGFVVLWSQAAGLVKIHSDTAPHRPNALHIGQDLRCAPRHIAVADNGSSIVLVTDQQQPYVLHREHAPGDKAAWYALPLLGSGAAVALTCAFSAGHPLLGHTCRITAVHCIRRQVPSGPYLPPAPTVPDDVSSRPCVFYPAGAFPNPRDSPHPLGYVAASGRLRGLAAVALPVLDETPNTAPLLSQVWAQSLVVTDLRISFTGCGMPRHCPETGTALQPPVAAPLATTVTDAAIHDVTEGFSAAGQVHGTARNGFGVWLVA